MRLKEIIGMRKAMSTPPALTEDSFTSVDSHEDECALEHSISPPDELCPIYNISSAVVCTDQELGFYTLHPNSSDELTGTLQQSVGSLNDDCTELFNIAQKPAEEVLHEFPADKQPKGLFAACQGVAGSDPAQHSPETACKIANEAFPTFANQDNERSDVDFEASSAVTLVHSETERSPDLQLIENRLRSKNRWEVMVAFLDALDGPRLIPTLLDTGCGCNLFPLYILEDLGLTANIQPAGNAMIMSLSGHQVRYIGTIELSWSRPNTANRKPVKSLFFVVPRGEYATNIPTLGGDDIASNDILRIHRAFGGSVYGSAHRFNSISPARKQSPETILKREFHEKVVSEQDDLTKRLKAEKRKNLASAQASR